MDREPAEAPRISIAPDPTDDERDAILAALALRGLSSRPGVAENPVFASRWASAGRIDAFETRERHRQQERVEASNETACERLETVTNSDGRLRARELGIRIGRFETGPWNAITDVQGVSVGHTTLIQGDGQLVVGKGPVRTGVTVIFPHGEGVARDPVFAGYHQLNGNGEMTGVAWIEEAGLLTSPISITNTHSVGTVRDAVIAWEARADVYDEDMSFGLPVVAETYDGWLNDINGFHVTMQHVFDALDSAATGPVAEGCVGGGTGMICHEFKGGIGTSSRRVQTGDDPWTVGVLVQANYGYRHLLRIDGVPVGEEITVSEVPSTRIVPVSGRRSRLDHHHRCHRRAASAASVQAAGQAGHDRPGPHRGIRVQRQR